MKDHRYRRIWPLLMLAACVSLTACGPKPAEAPQPSVEVSVLLDGAALIDLPFSEPRTVAIVQPDGAENVVAITGDAVRMERANCDNQDCVNMGEVTLENLEMRVMGGFIICLPHRVSVEVRQ